MNHESNEEREIVIEDTEQDFNYWLTRPYITTGLREKLRNTDILIVPKEGIRDFEKPLFPVKTEEMFTYLRNNMPGNKKIDICIEEKDYKELALHYDIINIATFIVTSIALPMLINILSNYIQNKITKGNDQRIINVTLLIQKSNGNVKKVTYEGEPESFNDTIKSVKDLWED